MDKQSNSDDKNNIELVNNKLIRCVLKLYYKEKSMREISRTLDIPRQTVGFWIHKFKEDPVSLNNDNRDRPQALTDREKRVILKDITNDPFTTIDELKNSNKLTVSRSTIHRHLKNSDLTSRTPTKKIILSQKHKTERLEFANKHLFESFTSTVFSDEKKFNMDGPDCYSKHWGKKNEEIVYKNQRKFGGGSIMVHVAISYFGPVSLCEMVGTYDAEDFITLLNDKVLPTVQQFFPNGSFVFQQDNASIHNARYAKDYYTEKGLEILKWPARSPDLNPVENIFSLLSEEIYKKGKIYTNIDELWESIVKAFENLDHEIIKKLYDGMKKRLLQVIKNNGGIIKY